jgi:hypothetical protein
VVTRMVVSTCVSPAAVVPMMMTRSSACWLDSPKQERGNYDQQQDLKNVFHGEAPKM